MRCTWICAIWSRGSLTEKTRNNYASERISDTRDEYAAAELRECDLYAFRPDGRGGLNRRQDRQMAPKGSVPAGYGSFGLQYG